MSQPITKSEACRALTNLNDAAIMVDRKLPGPENIEQRDLIKRPMVLVQTFLEAVKDELDAKEAAAKAKARTKPKVNTQPAKPAKTKKKSKVLA